MVSLARMPAGAAATLGRPAVAGALAGGILLLFTGLLSYWSYTARLQEEQQQTLQAALDARDQVRVSLLHGLSATQTVALMVTHGLLPARFDSIAPAIAGSYPALDAIELAPEGIVQHVHPFDENKRALGFNILTDPRQRDEAVLAIKERRLVFAGPLELVQGGLGVVGRGPVFFQRNGREEFWGFTIVIIRVSSLIRHARLTELEERGYRFRLARLDPIAGKMTHFYNSDVPMTDPCVAPIPVPNGEWAIELEPAGGWRAGYETLPLFFLSALLSTLTGAFVWHLRRQPERLRVLVDDRTADLLRSESRFRSLIEQAPVGIFLTRDGRFLYANPAFHRMAHMPVDGELAGMDVARFLAAPPPEDLEQGPHERVVLGVDGTTMPVETSHTPIELVDGPAEIHFIVDITEAKRSRKQVTDSLHEKILLLKEVHHRVKNNLQVISSLLSIQSGYLTDRAAREAYQDSMRRIRSMALVHERLYRSGDLAQIDFADYLRSVTDDLLHSLRRNGVVLTVEADPVRLGVDIAVPCGLIVNELVTNALKHAYPDGNGGSIRVGFTRRPAGLLELTVADDGVGMPEGSDVFTMPSMGMTIVRTLTEQIRGKLGVGAGKGAHFTVTFPG